jgi:hypothetical protein
MDLNLIVVIVCVFIFYSLFARYLWWCTRNEWGKYERHTCGKIVNYGRSPCPQCGKPAHGEWKVVFARAHLFSGWEWKYPEDVK